MRAAALIRIRSAERPDDPWRRDLLERFWGSTRVVTRGRLHDAAALPALVATLGPDRVGLVTYRFADEECEIVTLNSTREGRGVGSKLLRSLRDLARTGGCRRLWLITTNDNTRALGFYQKRGFVIAAVYPGAIARSRELKPEIPATGSGGIPIRDEIELEVSLA